MDKWTAYVLICMIVVVMGSAAFANYLKTQRYETCIAHHQPAECK